MALTMDTVVFRGDLDLVTPMKSLHPGEITPRRSERKRALFPTSSPQTSDLGHISPLGSSPDRFSSAPPTPESGPLSPAKPINSTSPFGRKASSCLRISHRISPRRRFSELFGQSIGAALKQEIVPLPRSSPKTNNAHFRHSPRSLDRSQEIVPVDQLEQTLLSVMDESDCGDSPRSHVSQRTPGATPRGSNQCKPISEAIPSQPVTPSKRRSLPVLKAGSTSSSSSQSPKSQRRLSLDIGSKNAELSRARASLFSENGRFPGVKRKSDDGIYLTGRSTKRRKTMGEINAGVRTGIRRPPKPKPKKKRPQKQSSKVKSVSGKSYVKKSKTPPGINLPEIPKVGLIPKGPTRSPADQASFSASAALQVRSKQRKAKEIESSSEEEEERIPSPPPDPTKRFFKTNRTIINRKATVTVSKNLKLKVNNGKFMLDKSGNTPVAKKKRKLYNHAGHIDSINLFDDKQEDVADSTRGDVQNILRKLDEEKEEPQPNGQAAVLAVTSTELPPDSELPPTATPTIQIPSHEPNGAPVLSEEEHFNPTQIQSPPRHSSAPTVSVGLLSPLSELASSTSTLSLNIGGDILCMGAAQVKALTAVPDIVMEDDYEPTVDNSAPPGAHTDAELETVMFPRSPQACKENESCVANVKNEGNDQKLFSIFNRNYRTGPTDTTQDSGRKRKRPSWRPIGNDQYQIDAGQKRFGASQCSECRLWYQLGDPEDEIVHSEYHKSRNALKHPGWKNERVVGIFGGNRVIVVKPGDPKPWWSKVMEVMKVVDKDLGFIDVGIRNPEATKVFLYISDKQIVGCLVSEPLKTAYRLLISQAETGGVDCCSAEEYPVHCGVSRVWVKALNRRRHIATELMDCMRRNFLYGSILTKEDIAFSSPTSSGKQFAESYTGRSDFYVYM